MGSIPTPQGGLFKLDITIPERYPLEPPNIRSLFPQPSLALA